MPTGKNNRVDTVIRILAVMVAIFIGICGIREVMTGPADIDNYTLFLYPAMLIFFMAVMPWVRQQSNTHRAD